MKKDHKGGHKFEPTRPIRKEGQCAWLSGCKNKALKGLSMCRKHQPYPATAK